MSWGPEKAHPSLLSIVALFLSTDSKSQRLQEKWQEISKKTLIS
jgi:hypothetical protein